MDKAMIGFILEACRGKVCEYSCNVNGCRVIQRILERFDYEEIGFILQEVKINLRELRTDIYGNYVVSHILEFGELKDRQ